MSRKSPAFSFYPDSWVLGTMAMSFEDQGLYLRMLCFQWANGPSDANAYANACGFAYKSHVDRILSSKFVCINGIWQNERLEHERAAQIERSEKAKTSAKLRWNAEKLDKSPPKKQLKNDANAYANGDANAYANAMPSVSDSINTTSKEVVREGRAPAPRNRVAASPSIGDVRDYIREAGLTQTDPEAFLDHYEANGWKQSNGNAITDWKAAARNWNRRQPQYAAKSRAGPLKGQDLVDANAESSKRLLEKIKNGTARDVFEVFDDVGSGQEPPNHRVVAGSVLGRIGGSVG